MENIKDLVNWILQCDEFVVDGATGMIFDIPSYEITPKDFLKYAQIDLHENNIKGKVGVISNLKRALDCELDMFFEAINLKGIFNKYNLKFERKTQFLSDIGMFPNKSVNKLNQIRNRMEHQFTIPSVDDLEVYYELIWNIIEIVNLNLQLMTMGEVEATIKKNEEEFYFSDSYDVENRSFKFRIHNDNKEYQLTISLNRQEDYEEFTKAFLVFRAIIEIQNLMDITHFMQLLREIC
ncbi:hypothetical protein V3C10_02360 [[Clostridium] symbiosum]|uniref:hypothetical protein n=1 Tax=Clostridium symbiosum TaxID=1512 RepID=UPI001D06024C|nr:hypothetical protein [[Clostridium] symbiosum]MCB6608539.1 hypothetical protein [[Clostridium] symbiosum]MCB6932149.1 hypothetical protein [[Clostridium] symbiosum]